jgi:hypothetical protein
MYIAPEKGALFVYVCASASARASGSGIGSGRDSGLAAQKAGNVIEKAQRARYGRMTMVSRNSNSSNTTACVRSQKERKYLQRACQVLEMEIEN